MVNAKSTKAAEIEHKEYESIDLVLVSTIVQESFEHETLIALQRIELQWKASKIDGKAKTTNKQTSKRGW